MTVKVLIVGYGFIGQLLGQELKKDGHQVWGIKRNSIAHTLEKLIQKDILQLQDEDLPDVDFVVYCPSSDATRYGCCRKSKFINASIKFVFF